MDGSEEQNLYGVVEDLVYRNADSAYTVLDVSAEDGELITVVGLLPEISAGEEVHFIGKWDRHPTFGRQFRAESVERTMPSSAASMLKYLASGTVSGIGPSLATKIVETFGENTFDILENYPEKLAQIKGISLPKAQKICADFRRSKNTRDIMIRLEALGLTTNESIAAYRFFGKHAPERVAENPYILCIPEIGMGFERADTLAEAMETKPDPSYRTEAGIIHVVTYNLSSNGHTCLPREKLLTPCADLLDTDKDTIDIAMDTLTEHKRLVAFFLDGVEFVSLPYIYEAERLIALKIKRMVKFPPAGREAPEKEVDRLEKENGIKYETLQREAILTAVRRGILILTGGPGTGKTTTVNGMLSLFERDGLKVVLCAPTGRAAQRMSEITGKEASTIHRLLECSYGTDDRLVFEKNEQNPIDADVVIVDELSMVDVILFSALLSALPLGCRLVMVGDNDQLPAVGAGSVLHDLRKSGLLPVIELTEVYRQETESLIVTNAHRIVNGEEPELTRVDNDFFHMERQDAGQTVIDITNLFIHRLPKAYGYSPMTDIQILCPTKKGDAGTVNLNRVLQEAVNPPKKGKNEYKSMTRVLREGDKVMQTKNNYDIPWSKTVGRRVIRDEGIFNGDIGTIIEIKPRAGEIKVDFDGRIATYPSGHVNELELAYAVTVHKSQGSEFPAVIMPVIGVPPNLCYRNLLYTAVTRAKNKMITIGMRETIDRMVENDRKIKRYSALYYFLKAE